MSLDTIKQGSSTGQSNPKMVAALGKERRGYLATSIVGVVLILLTLAYVYQLIWKSINKHALLTILAGLVGVYVGRSSVSSDH